MLLLAQTIAQAKGSQLEVFDAVLAYSAQQGQRVDDVEGSGRLQVEGPEASLQHGDVETDQVVAHPHLVVERLVDGSRHFAKRGRVGHHLQSDVVAFDRFVGDLFGVHQRRVAARLLPAAWIHENDPELDDFLCLPFR